MGSLFASDNFKTRLIWMVYKTLQKVACHFSDLTIFQNHTDSRQFLAAGVVAKQKTKVILGSGVATDIFDPALFSEMELEKIRDELGIRLDEIVVTMISRVIRSKGVLDFMTAAQQISAQYPKVRFLLVGPDDNESVDRLSTVELTQLKQAVTWPGPRQDIPAVLALTDVFVLPSAYREGMPRVLLEAASMQLPIVTTDTAGCNEVVEHGVNGLHIPLHAPSALSQAISLLLEQPDLCQRFGQESRRRAEEYFNLSVVADQTGAVYRQLLEHKTPLSV
jgi:glycosyltransferase involved in cell wall biosynthesis